MASCVYTYHSPMNAQIATDSRSVLGKPRMLGFHSPLAAEENSAEVTYAPAVRGDPADAPGDGERLAAAGEGERLLLAALGAERLGVARLFSCGFFASEAGEKGCVAVERRVLRRIVRYPGSKWRTASAARR